MPSCTPCRGDTGSSGCINTTFRNRISDHCSQQELTSQIPPFHSCSPSSHLYINTMHQKLVAAGGEVCH